MDGEALRQVRALLNAGAALHVRDSYGATALMYAAGYSASPQMLSLLAAKGIELDAQDDTGRSALMWAAEFASSSEVVEALLDLGADASLVDHSRETAWDLIQRNRTLRGTTAYRRLRSVSVRDGG